jgi:hypothetical protein
MVKLSAAGAERAATPEDAEDAYQRGLEILRPAVSEPTSRWRR